VALWSGVFTEIQAQDFFRDLGTSRSSGGIGPGITTSDYSYTDAAPSAMHRLTPVDTQDNDKYNFALGPLRFGVAVGVGIEWNDNIALSNHNRESDFILRPLINLDVAWPISDHNTLRLTLGASWAKYFEHSEFDSGGLIISPTSALEMGIDVGAVHITLRDRFSYQEDPYSAVVLSNVANYRRYENQAGIEVDWPINQNVNLGIGYDHFNLWTNGSEFSSQDHSIDTVYVRPTVQVTPGIKVGLFASFSEIAYDDSARADAQAFMVGPTVDIKFNEHLSLYAEVGYQAINNDGTSNFSEVDDKLFSGFSTSDPALLNDSSDSGGLYFKVELAHKASPIFEHAVTASRTSELGFFSNTYELYHFEYAANYKGIRNTEIGPIIFYDHYKTSGNLSETADRYGAAIGIRHHLTNSITLGLDYRFLYQNSDQPDSDYHQNLIFLSAYYRF
jgi:opacity protein-like surface antigen